MLSGRTIRAVERPRRRTIFAGNENFKRRMKMSKHFASERNEMSELASFERERGPERARSRRVATAAGKDEMPTPTFENWDQTVSNT